MGDLTAALVPRRARVIGYDMNEGLLREARSKRLSDAEFRRLDLGCSDQPQLLARPPVQFHRRLLYGHLSRAGAVWLLDIRDVLKLYGAVLAARGQPEALIGTREESQSDKLINVTFAGAVPAGGQLAISGPVSRKVSAPHRAAPRMLMSPSITTPRRAPRMTERLAAPPVTFVGRFSSIPSE